MKSVESEPNVAGKYQLKVAIKLRRAEWNWIILCGNCWTCKYLHKIIVNVKILNTADFGICSFLVALFFKQKYRDKFKNWRPNLEKNIEDINYKTIKPHIQLHWLSTNNNFLICTLLNCTLLRMFSESPNFCFPWGLFSQSLLKWKDMRWLNTV